jgi:AAA domain, putative AbiEii toxin, Type IV TA system
VKIRSIKATEVFSFRDIEVVLDPTLTVLVGPNGAGKTNLVRLLDIARTAVNWHASAEPAVLARMNSFRSARRIGATPNSKSTVEVAVDLDQPEERDLMTALVRAAAFPVIHGADREAALAEVIPWVEREITEDKLEELFHGRLIVEIPREEIDHWEACYRFSCAEADYEIPLTMGSRITPAGDSRSTNGITNYSLAGVQIGGQSEFDPKLRWSLAGAMPRKGQAVALEVDLDQSPDASEIMRHLIRVAEIRTDQGVGRGYRFVQGLDRILTLGLVLGPELRGAPEGRYTLADLAAEAPFEAERVPVELLRFKTGDFGAKARFEAVRGLFHEISGRQFDVQNVPNGADQATSTARVTLLHADHEVPLEFSGMGAWEALVISTLLAGATGRTVVLDEPALNLHPGAQRRVVAKLRELGGNQFVVITHSPYLVPSEDGQELARIVRIDQVNGLSTAHRLSATAPTEQAKVVKALTESADARALLFADGVVLLGGDTELVVLPRWFAASPTAKTHGTPEDLNIVCVNVGGDGGYGTFLGLLNSFHIPWVAVCDGKCLQREGQDSGKQIVAQVAKRCGEETLLALWNAWGTRTPLPSFAEIAAVARDHGVFTLAPGSEPEVEGFEAFLTHVDAALMKEALTSEPESKPRRARYFVERHATCPPEVEDLYAALLKTLDLGTVRN